MVPAEKDLTVMPFAAEQGCQDFNSGTGLLMRAGHPATEQVVHGKVKDSE